ncbi:hypothetical protein [Spirosoma panaciterrae]|uniref:hypothetical protein n=1 Tax=Spirosoma panaciterrae TaxID=496058 RepID=UPI0012FC4878|nr:hypothetical protein [Spirosoma panaciterrae]
MLTRSWIKFFEGSQPFLLASISQTDLDGIEKDYHQRLDEARRDPSLEGLQLWISYGHAEIIKLLLTWQGQLRQQEISVTSKLDALIVNQLRDHFKAYIALLNGANRWYYTGQYDFNPLIDIAVWDLDLIDLYTTDESFYNAGKDGESISTLLNLLDDVFSAFLRVSRQLVELMPDAFDESLNPLLEEHRQTHAPHLGLLFAFLELFNLFQGDLNRISQQHLEFFYQKVLRIKPLPAIPDSVHLLLETAQTVKDPYLVKQGTPLLATSKDNNNADVRFETDNEIIVDKAQVKELKTLYLNPVQVGGKPFVEGLYVAPVADSMDGQGVAFPDPKVVQWPTLGRKESPRQFPGKEIGEPYPPARLGWIFASPVLLLNEGKRTITITIQGIHDKNRINSLEGPGKERVLEKLSKLIADSMGISFSGKEKWIAPSIKPEIQIDGLDTDNLTITIKATLDDDLPPVVFLDKEAWKVKENDYRPDLPSVRVLLNPEFFIDEKAGNVQSKCGLQIDPPSTGSVSLYYYLRELRITDTQINVEVCGVKNLIVQNDENLQDVNNPIYPFGTRPNIPDFSIINREEIEEGKLLTGPNFYIGSQEVLLKNWQDVSVNIRWKDKPDNLDKYYAAYGYSEIDPVKKTFERNFGLRIGALTDKIWHEGLHPRELFKSDPAKERSCSPVISDKPDPDKPDKEAQHILIQRTDIDPELIVPSVDEFKKPFTELTVDTRFGFLRFTLENQDFLHKDYPIVLARQMMALGKYPTEFIINATYLRTTEGDVFGFTNPAEEVKKFEAAIQLARKKSKGASDAIDETIDALNPIDIPDDPTPDDADLIRIKENNTSEKTLITKREIDATKDAISDLNKAKKELFKFLGGINEWRRNPEKIKVLIPQEPYTPVIKEISVDYRAVASVCDIDLVHLYPFERTYKNESLHSNKDGKCVCLSPTLLPTFTDEGTLYIGLSDLRPNGTLNLLFQLAENTADSELDKVEVHWSYLLHNEWKTLNPLTNILADGTDGLTRSGIIKIAVPYDIPPVISDEFPDPKATILPPNRYWLRASVRCNARAIANTIGIHTQAVRATFVPTPANDTNRLSEALPAESISKLLEADSSISTIQQPYASFGGKPAEQTNNLYRRIGEQLRHKGRAISLFDYERLALEAFPTLFRAKCITHTLGLPASLQIECSTSNAQTPTKNASDKTCQTGPFCQDLEIAPGFVLVAVIPHVGQLQTNERYEPRVPVGVLNEIESLLKQKASPFVRLKAMNPRYEKVDVEISVRFCDGLDRTFYEKKLNEDIRLFFSPWVTGDTTRLAFGLSVRYSDLVQFVEKLSYVDYITNLSLTHQEISTSGKKNKASGKEIKPLTARSILTAGVILVTKDPNQPLCS